MGPKYYHKYPYKRETEGNLKHTEKAGCKYGGRYWSDTATSQEIPGAT